MSHRYGARCLPERILAREFEILKGEIAANNDNIDLSFRYGEEDGKDVDLDVENLFEYCYELDENERPARCRLVRLEKVFAKYNPKKPIFEKVWAKIEAKLGNILRKMATLCYEKNLFNKTQYERFFVSGILKTIFNSKKQNKQF